MEENLMYTKITGRCWSEKISMQYWWVLLIIGIPYKPFMQWESGKDVYVEKPLANSIEECLALEKAGKRYNRVVQVGQQQRSGQHWNDAADYLQSGALGRISNVKCFLNYGNSRKLETVPDAEAPEGVDYTTWLGPAPHRPFNKNRFHGSWRYYWDYGGGIMTDWGFTSSIWY
jgi:predicted dehydrogenase